MSILYNLVLHKDGAAQGEIFDIGFFSTHEKAEETAERYLSEVSGFKDGGYSSIITEKKLVGCDEIAECGEVYVIYGYNTDSQGNGVDIVTSDCLGENADTGSIMEEMRKTYSRRYRGIDDYVIDECWWQEGI